MTMPPDSETSGHHGPRILPARGTVKWFGALDAEAGLLEPEAVA